MGMDYDTGGLSPLEFITLLQEMVREVRKMKKNAGLTDKDKPILLVKIIER